MGPGPSIWGARRRQKFLPHQTPTTLAASSAKPKKSARQQNPFSLEIVKMRVVLVSGGVISGVGKGEYFFSPLSFLSCLNCWSAVVHPPANTKQSRSCPSMKYIFICPATRRDAPGLAENDRSI